MGSSMYLPKRFFSAWFKEICNPIHKIFKPLSNIIAFCQLNRIYIPKHPTAHVRVGRVDGQLVLNPIQDQIEQSDFDLVVAGTWRSVILSRASM